MGLPVVCLGVQSSTELKGYTMRIIISKKAAPEIVAMLRKAYHKAHGTRYFADPDVIVES